MRSGYGYIVSGLISAALCMWFLTYTAPVPETVTHTVNVPVPQPPVYITAKAKVRYVRDTVLISRTGAPDSVYVRDTLYTTPPFVATLDTVVNEDTASISFRYPSMMFDVALKQSPDTLRIQTITVTVPEKRSVWVDIGTHAAAFFSGYFIGSVR